MRASRINRSRSPVSGRNHVPSAVSRRPCRQLPAPGAAASSARALRRRPYCGAGAARDRGRLHPRSRACPGARGPEAESPTASSAAPIFTSIFSNGCEGVETHYGEFVAHSSKDDGTEVGFKPPTMHVGSKIKWVGPIQGPDFDFLKSATTRTPKVCIPAPSMLHFRGGREAISEAVYPDLEDFYADLTAAYRAEIADLAARGLPLPAIRRHQSRLSLRSRHPRPHQGARRRPGRADPPLLPADQRFDPRPAART